MILSGIVSDGVIAKSDVMPDYLTRSTASKTRVRLAADTPTVYCVDALYRGFRVSGNCYSVNSEQFFSSSFAVVAVLLDLPPPHTPTHTNTHQHTHTNTRALPFFTGRRLVGFVGGWM